MTRMLSSLPEIESTVGPETIVVHDPADNRSKRIAAGNFRGAGWFTETSDNATPNNTWTGPAGHGPFKDGDMKRLTSTAGSSTTLWYWDVTLNTGDGGWAQFNDFTVAAIHTSVSLSVETYEIATIATLNAVFTPGDFYRHLTLMRIYGPYHGTTGFDFDPDGRAYQSLRGPIQHVVTTGQLANRGIAAWSPFDITDKLEAAYAPVRGDTFLQRFVGASHGGFLWSWDQEAYEASNVDPLTDRTAGWGTKVYARQPKTFSFGVVPAEQDDTLFIPGDHWRVTGSENIWGPYVVGQASRDLAWGSGPSVTGAAEIKTATVDMTTADRLERYAFPRDDATYALGDHVIVTYTSNEINTPILMGPYPASGAWPIIQTLRQPHEFTITQNVGDGGVFGTIPIHTDGRATIFNITGRPSKGDIFNIVHVYPNGHATETAGTNAGRVESKVLADELNATGSLSFDQLEYHTQLRTITTLSLGRPARSQELYNTGDMAVNLAGDWFGPFLEAQGTDVLAWPNATTANIPTANQEQDGATPADNYAPTRDDTLYVGGQYLRVNHTIGTTDLPILYGPYVSGAATDILAWPEASIQRAPITIRSEMPTGTGGVYGAWIPDNSADDALYQASGLPFMGDTLELRSRFPAGHATGTAGELTGRTRRFEITGINRTTRAVAMTEVVSLQPVRFLSTATPGVIPRDDEMYNPGDFLIDSIGAFFGPYLVGQASDVNAWPDAVDPTAVSDVVLTQETTSAIFSAHLDALGRVYFKRASDDARIYVGGGNVIAAGDTDDFQTIFKGATATDAGLSGDVPAPLIADQNSFLKGDGTWSAAAAGAEDILVTDFTSGSGTFVWHEDCVYAIVRCWGGGGGRSAWGGSSNLYVHAVGGGGAGAYEEIAFDKTFMEQDVGVKNIPYGVGAGSAGNGAKSYFGRHVQGGGFDAQAHSYGSVATNHRTCQGGAGGVISTGGVGHVGGVTSAHVGKRIFSQAGGSGGMSMANISATAIGNCISSPGAGGVAFGATNYDYAIEIRNTLASGVYVAGARAVPPRWGCGQPGRIFYMIYTPTESSATVSGYNGHITVMQYLKGS